MDENSRDNIFSKSLRAGRRTYFFDVRETRAGDYYLTITESKKFTNEDGSSHYKKHKIYLYKEDFKEFVNSLQESTDFIFNEKGEDVITDYVPQPKQAADNNPIETFTDVKFEDI